MEEEEEEGLIPTGRGCRVRVLFFGSIQGVVGRREDELVLQDQNATVRDALDEMSRRYGDDFRGLVTHSSHSSLPVTIFADGKPVIEERDLGARIKSGSEIEICLVTQMWGG